MLMANQGVRFRNLGSVPDWLRERFWRRWFVAAGLMVLVGLLAADAVAAPVLVGPAGPEIPEALQPWMRWVASQDSAKV